MMEKQLLFPSLLFLTVCDTKQCVNQPRQNQQLTRKRTSAVIILLINHKKINCQLYLIIHLLSKYVEHCLDPTS